MKKLLLGIWLLSLVACSSEEEVLKQDLPISSTKLLSSSDGAVYYSRYSDGRNPRLLADATVSGGLYAWFEAASPVTEVRFLVDGQWIDQRVERIPPYSLGGDRGDGQLLAYDTDKLSTGGHTLIARVLFKNSDTPQEYSVSFKVGEPAGLVFYVATNGSDSNDGRRVNSAFKTISKAAQTVKPGDTVKVAPGVYADSVVSVTSGLPDKRITFVSTEKHGAVVDASGAYTAWLNEGSYVDIVGFEVTGSDYLGIYNKGSYVTIQGNHVHHLAAPTCNGGNGGAGILHGNYEAHHNVVAGNLVHDILPPEGCSLIHGIYVSNQQAEILNNIVYNIRGYGIHTWHYATQTTISGNLVLNNGYGGILVGGGEVVMSGAVVTNNIVVNNRFGAGIYEIGKIGPNTYRNNLLWGNRMTLRPSADEAFTLTADPLLITSASAYQLEASSPAVDQGTELGVSAFDYEGQRRIAPFDIGPFNLEKSVAE